MPALPACDRTLTSTLTSTSDRLRVVPFNPLADPAALARKRTALLAQLADERAKPHPDAWLVKAYETWLRTYQRITDNRTTDLRRAEAS
jgi:hypothetical protein